MTPGAFRARHALIALAAAAFSALAPPAHAAPIDFAAPQAATLLDTTLRAPAAADRACHIGVLAGRRGAVTRTVVVPAAGEVSATLKGAAGDWDLAIFDASNRLVGGGASPGPGEIASGWALGGGPLVVQACRRTGGGATADLQIRFTKLDTSVRPEPLQLVSVDTPTRADKDRLVALGLDMTEHGGRTSLGVVLHGADDAAMLRRAGFTWTVHTPDLVARSLRERAAEERLAARGGRSALPSGRETYRQLADYESEMKALAKDNPGLVKLIELPHKTLLGRTVLGLEITTDVNARDGKPAFMNLGVHHAREWPSGEHAMEWAYELINGYKKGDPRVKRIVEQGRNIVVPIVNPDGFNASRTAGVGADGGRDESVPDTAYLIGGAATGGEYRRKNCRLGEEEQGNCLTAAGVASNGTDPNRNYGGLWGGPGASTDITSETYRGPGPFSEAETRNIQTLISRNQVVTMITNHTTAGLVLRAPGLAALGDPVDENAGYKALGDELALHNGYFSQKSFELYDTTGTTEDWSYNATGGFGFTFEIYCGEPNYVTGNCDDPAFHPLFPTMVAEWDGTSPQADHANDPGRSQDAPFGNVKNFDGKGNREAYYIAAESTINEERHSILRGRAEPGTILRLRKAFKTETYPQEDGKPITFDDKLETFFDVGPSGAVRWHVNPSTRPIVGKDRGVRDPGAPAPPQTQTGGPQGSPADPNDDGIAAPNGGEVPGGAATYNEHPITVPATGDNGSANIKIVWTTPTSDWDVVLFQDRNGNGDIDGADLEIGSSGQGTTTEEEVGIFGDPRLAPGAKYILQVNNYAATEPYEVQIRWNGPLPFKAGQTETYQLTCEAVDGTVLQSRDVFVARGQTADIGTGCRDLGRGAQAGRRGGFRFAAALDTRRMRRALRRGIRARVRCSEPCRAVVALRVKKKVRKRLGLKSRTVARGAVRRAAGRRTFKVRFKRDARRKLRQARRVRLRIVSTGRELDGKRKVVLRRSYRLIRRLR
jgi:murein tripeptide amidase MpaA